MKSRTSRPQQLGILLAVAVVYAVAGKLGLRLGFVNASVTAVWPPTGIALAAVLILGRWVWPAIFAGAFVVNVTTAGGAAVSLGIATGNTVEALLGAWLLARFARGRRAFDHPGDVVRYAALAGLGSTAVAATVGVTSLALGGAARWEALPTIWVTWWLGDASGNFVIAPLILLTRESYGIAWDIRRGVEAALLAVAAVLVAGVVFGGLLPGPTKDYPLDFLPMTIFIWAALRFGRRGAAVAVVLVYAVAVRGTLSGYGPFASYPRNEALLLLQVFTCVASLTAMMLAAVVLERRRSEDELRQLAVSDPLTGLANYRQLIEVLEGEVRRSLRTQRPFAVLFLDLDDLKKLNDRFGHLAGSRALVRVAQVLRRTCRAIDTAARYGGDEFALVLPETDEVAAEQVARRVTELLASDTEQPPISVSLGVAAYPRNGATAVALLAAADRALYGEKARTAGRSRSSLP